MADYQARFKRVEYKYLMNPAQTAALEEAIGSHMSLDGYGRTEIRNVYFDTPDWVLARRSIEKPKYKEKLRLRCYGAPDGPDSRVYAEIKKKYDGVVYKRRIGLTFEEANEWMTGGKAPSKVTQIETEIDWMLHFYPNIRSAMNLDYERRAYYQASERGFRVTLDQNIMARTDDIGLDRPSGGTAILPKGYSLMEVKSPGGIPMWMVDVMSSQRLYKFNFSKYGNAYKMIVLGHPTPVPIVDPVKGLPKDA